MEEDNIFNFTVEPTAVQIPTVEHDPESRNVNNSNPRSNENNSSDQERKNITEPGVRMRDNVPPKDLESLNSSATLASRVSGDEDAEDSTLEDEEEVR